MKKISSILIIAIALFATSCKKDETSPKNTKQVLDFHWHSMVGSAEAALATTYTSNGVKFNLSSWRYYVSNFILIKADGSELKIADKVFLINMLEHDYSLDSVPVGNYKGFKFTLGLDSITNHKDPTLYSSENPLAIQTLGIHWSWNSGYIFFMAEGQYDSTATTLSPNKEFFFHVGTDELKRTIDFSNSPFSVVSGADKTIGIEMDFLKAIENLDLETENATHSFGALKPTAVKIANNWQAAFSLE